MTDNSIEWIFEKIFLQITLDGKELYTMNSNQINQKTFANSSIHLIIENLTKKTHIAEFINEISFKRRFLFKITKNKINTEILLNSSIQNLLDCNHKINPHTLQLIVQNDRLDLLQCLNEKLHPELLMYVESEIMYNYLRKKDLDPNITILNKLITKNLPTVINDIISIIDISPYTIKLAFESNHTNQIKLIVEIIKKEKKHLDQNLMAHPILHANFELINWLDEQKLIHWHEKLAYSAVLSGNLSMIKLLEEKIPDLHQTHQLDLGSVCKGQSSLLIPHMLYKSNNKNYFSHMINYSIQSKELLMLKYIHSLGYQITPSNFITMIKQGTIQMAQFMGENYTKKLPFYLINYAGINSFAKDKVEKFIILVKLGLINLKPSELTLDEYKLETVHLKIINGGNYIDEDNLFDLDYLMKYVIFFEEKSGFKMNYRLISIVRLCLHAGMEDLIIQIKQNLNESDKELFVNTLYLFGTINQIKEFGSGLVPTDPVLMEIITYGLIGKVNVGINAMDHLMRKNFIIRMNGLALMLNNPLIKALFNKICDIELNTKFIILSGNKDEIKKIPRIKLSGENLRQLIKLDDVNLLKNFDFDIDDRLVRFVEEEDLIEIRDFILALQ